MGLVGGPGGGNPWSGPSWSAKSCALRRMLKLKMLSKGGGDPGSWAAHLRSSSGVAGGVTRLARRVLTRTALADAAAVAATVCLPASAPAASSTASAPAANSKRSKNKGMDESAARRAGAAEASLLDALGRLEAFKSGGRPPRAGFVVAGGARGARAVVAVRRRRTHQLRCTKLVVSHPATALPSRCAVQPQVVRTRPVYPTPAAPAVQPKAPPCLALRLRSSDDVHVNCFENTGDGGNGDSTGPLWPWPLPIGAAARDSKGARGYLDLDLDPSDARRPAKPSVQVARAASPPAPPAPTLWRSPAPAPTPTPSQLPVFKWAKLEMVEKLGAGSFGVVQKALLRGSNGQPNVHVAVKVPHDTAGASLLHEASMLCKLRHPNLVRVFGVCRNPTALVSALVPHGALATALERRQGVPLPLSACETVLKGVALGFAFLHSRQPPIVHRDLSSNNVLLGKNWHPHVADFGLSKLRVTSCISNGTEMGTPNYMAPEVLSSGKITEKADVYSFGVLMWEVLTGQTPWAEYSAYQIIYQVCFAGERPKIPETCNKSLAELMQACWHKDPVLRPGFEYICKSLDESFQTMKADQLGCQMA
mmetsp:Transcript_34178/g.65293  ORF Transcript_34178/g.65293 Transcript_34178/m.65293 type:complete len:592 (+) Transcript_34178:185-1960(+)